VSRHLFGDIGSFTVAAGNSETVGAITGYATLLVPSVTVTFWNAVTGGSQYTDLLDTSSNPIAWVTTDSNGAIPQFYGPDGVTTAYADAGGGRRAMAAIDLGDDVAANQAVLDAMQTTVAALAPVATSGAYSDLSGAPAFAPVATSGVYTDLTGRPAPGLQIVAKIGGTWPTRNTTAPDATRLAMWVGPSPAPPSGSGYAIAGDLWAATPA
jgi:hypothetical protein